MKKCITLLLFFVITACSQQSQSTAVEIEMPQDCREYFDGLKQLAKQNQNLADKFGEELAQIDQAWQVLSSEDREAFSEQCIIRNQKLKEMQGTPELEKLLNEL